MEDEKDERVPFDRLSARDKRSLIFHLLYAAESHEYNLSIPVLVEMINQGYSMDIPLQSDLVKMAQAITDQRDELDAVYKPYLANWRFDRLGISTKLILRYAIWELLYTDTAPLVIINEAIELAKCFAEKDAYKFINGILDEALKKDPQLAKKYPPAA
jgi:N utilization substance protein B